MLREEVPVIQQYGANTSLMPAHSVHIPLPAIQLPIFSGAYRDWESFRDMFTSIIHLKKELSNVQKLHYLKSFLKGEAEQLLKNVTISENNYAGAWDALIKRYDNHRLLVTSHLSRLFALPSITSESPSALKSLTNDTIEIIRALNNLGRPVGQWDDVLVYLTAQKLDPESRREWEKSITSNNEMPLFEELEEFLEGRIQVLEALDSTKSKSTSQSTNSKSNRSNVQSFLVNTSKCQFCQKGQHALFLCRLFKKQAVSKRREFIQSAQLCFNCLKADCPSALRCRKCERSHHTMLHLADSSSPNNKASPSNSFTSPSMNNTTTSYKHFVTPPSHNSSLSSVPTTSTPVRKPSATNQPNADIDNSNISSFVACPASSAPVLLATAKIIARSPSGKSIVMRALIDPGSEGTLIAESAVQRLNLSRSATNVTITGIGEAVAVRSKGRVTVGLTSMTDQNFSMEVIALIVPKLTNLLPSQKITISHWPHIEHIPLADPTFATPAHIDILIGADVFYSMLCDGIKRGPAVTPTAIETKFGWVLCGPTNCLPSGQEELRVHHVGFAHSETKTNTVKIISNQRTLERLRAVMWCDCRSVQILIFNVWESHETLPSGN